MKERYINFILFVIVLIVIILFGYTYLSYKNQDVSIASVQIDAKSFGLKVNESRQIEYMYLPEKASGEIRFRSSNEEVIEVNSITGYVTAKRVGSAIIEIIDANEEVLQFFEVYGLKQKVEIIEVGVEEEIKIANGKSYLMTKKPIPSNAVLPELKYVSSDENIVKVENNGKITGVGVGNAYIEIRSKDGKLEEKVLVSVGQSEEYTQEENTDYTIDVEKIELEKKTIKIKEGEIYQIEAKVKPENATNKELSYTSLDNKIVEILENGVIKGKSKGKTAIEIRSVNNKVKRVEVEVKEETKEEVKEEIKATGIEIEVEKISIVQGEKREINARIIPTNAENKKLTWTSSNKKVVEVENGIIEGKNIGKSTITIKTTNGIKREIEVEVVKKKIEVLDIGVNLEEVKIGIGGTATILTVVSPIDATNKTLKWESTNSSVATVNQEGFIKGISAGSCKIVVKANNGIQKEISVKVEKIEAQRLELSKEEISIKVGGTEKITYHITPTNVTENKVSFKSSNSSIVTVDNNGVVTGKRVGETTITATIGKINKSIKVSILSNEIKVNKVEITGNTNIKVGEQVKVTAKVLPSNATNQEVTFTSSNTKVATIDDSGVVKGINVGEVTITAKAGGKTASYKLKVEAVAVENIVVNKSQVTLEPNKSETITATILPSNATNKTLTWTSSNTNVVKVSSSGIITAIKDGNATITVKASNGKQAQISVIVKSKYIAVENININKTSLNLTKGNSETLIATITPSNATNKTLIWTSSNTSIAKVDTNGNILAVGVGSAVITVKSSNGKIAICNITVKDNTFQNPISRGGDPYVTQKDGYYYYTKTTGNNTIVIYKSKDLTKLESNPKTVFTSSNRKAIWAPEIHYVNGYWYIYYSDATSSDNASRRMYVLRSKTQDAQGEYEYLGQVAGMPNALAIDGTILQWKGEYYFLWSAYKDSTSKEQRIYIAHMSNPYTVDSSRVEIAKANYDWEKHGNFINEGPQVLIKDGTLHVIYSASGANTIYYCLGMLTYTGGDLLKTSSWKKSSKPVFESANGVYGPGHASFVKSPDGKEDWIVYHAVVSESDAKIWNRTIRIQKFTWNGTTPVFGKTLSIDTSITLPSGTK